MLERTLGFGLCVRHSAPSWSSTAPEPEGKLPLAPEPSVLHCPSRERGDLSGPGAHGSLFLKHLDSNGGRQVIKILMSRVDLVSRGSLLSRAVQGPAVEVNLSVLLGVDGVPFWVEHSLSLGSRLHVFAYPVDDLRATYHRHGFTRTAVGVYPDTGVGGNGSEEKEERGRDAVTSPAVCTLGTMLSGRVAVWSQENRG